MKCRSAAVLIVSMTWFTTACVVIEEQSASKLEQWARPPGPRRNGSERLRVRKTDLERFRETLLEQKMQVVAHARQMLAGEVHRIPVASRRPAEPAGALIR